MTKAMLTPQCPLPSVCFPLFVFRVDLFLCGFAKSVAKNGQVSAAVAT